MKPPQVDPNDPKAEEKAKRICDVALDDTLSRMFKVLFAHRLVEEVNYCIRVKWSRTIPEKKKAIEEICNANTAANI